MDKDKVGVNVFKKIVDDIQTCASGKYQQCSERDIRNCLELVRSDIGGFQGLKRKNLSQLVCLKLDVFISEGKLESRKLLERTAGWYHS